MRKFWDFIKARKLLTFSILLNVLLLTGIWLFVKDRSILIEWGPSKSIYGDKLFISASGPMITDNFEPANRFMLYTFKCSAFEKEPKCIAADVSFSKSFLMSIHIAEWEVIQWKDGQVVARQDYACREEFLKIDVQAETAVIESFYKTPDRQSGNCAGYDTDTRKMHIGDWNEVVANHRNK